VATGLYVNSTLERQIHRAQRVVMCECDNVCVCVCVCVCVKDRSTAQRVVMCKCDNVCVCVCVKDRSTGLRGW